jgi:hypothetical protein
MKNRFFILADHERVRSGFRQWNELDWPADGAHFLKLELRDRHGKLLSDNFYWHATDEH